MLPYFELIHRELDRFSLGIKSIMAEQANQIAGNLLLLFNELNKDITPEQEKWLKDAILTSSFLSQEIRSSGTTYSTVFKLFYQPTEVIWEKINLHAIIQQVLESVERDRLSTLAEFITVDVDKEMFVTVDVDKEMFVYSEYSLLFKVIFEFLTWAHLSSAANSISLSLMENETNIILKLSGYDHPVSNELEITSQRARNFSKEVVEFIVLLLGGTFNWSKGFIAPDKAELIIQLPKKPMWAVNFVA